MSGDGESSGDEGWVGGFIAEVEEGGRMLISEEWTDKDISIRRKTMEREEAKE